jgi:hypothetical protein
MRACRRGYHKDAAGTVLKEEEAMASWVDQNVAKVTLAYLNKAERAAA